MKTYLIVLIMLSLSAAGETSERCGTGEVYRAALRGDTRERPSDGPLFIYTPNFIVHYDTTGTHACTHAYAESIAVYAEEVRALEVGGLGFAAPPPDAGGPDSRYDIYVQDISPWHGYTYWGADYPDPYPGGRASYFLVLNDMSWEMLLDIVAHEFNHACQARYSDQYNWFYENTATWMEDICNEDYNWYIADLNTTPSPLTTPHMAITTITGSYEYAAAIWPMFLDEYYGLSCMRLVWEEIGLVGGYNTLNAINEVLNDYDSDLKVALGNYAVWRYFTGTRADTTSFFAESNLMPTSFVDPAHQHTGPSTGDQGSTYLQGPGGTVFIEFDTTPDYLLRNSLFGISAAEWLTYCIGYSSPEEHEQFMMDDIDHWAVLPAMQYDVTVMIPAVTSVMSGVPYEYTGEGICMDPAPLDDQELEVCSVISPAGTVAPYATMEPEAVLLNNASTSAVDSAWVSLYIGNWYCDSQVAGPLGPGQSDSLGFSDWTSVERNELDVRCVGGGMADGNVTNNICENSVTVSLSDFEVLEILSPRGVIAKNSSVAPGARIRNNGSSGQTIPIAFAVGSYSDVQSIYLDPGEEGELYFNDWVSPNQAGACSTICFLGSPDGRPCNDFLRGEVLVFCELGIEDDTFSKAATTLYFPEPNPFSSSTVVTFSVGEPGYVRLEVYDLSGRLRDTLLADPIEAGGYSVDFQAEDLTNGVYLIRLTAGSTIHSEKCVLIR